MFDSQAFQFHAVALGLGKLFILTCFCVLIQRNTWHYSFYFFISYTLPVLLQKYQLLASPGHQQRTTPHNMAPHHSVMSCMRVCRKQALSRVKYYYYVINSKIQQQQ